MANHPLFTRDERLPEVMAARGTGYVPSRIPEDITRLVFGIDDNGGHLQRLSVNETLVRLVLRQPEGGVWPRG